MDGHTDTNNLFFKRTQRFELFRRDVIDGVFGESVNRDHAGVILAVTNGVAMVLSEPVELPPITNGIYHTHRRTILQSSNPREKGPDIIVGSQGKSKTARNVIVPYTPRLAANPIHITQIRGLQGELLERASALVISLRYNQLTEHQVAAEHRGILKRYGLLR